MFMNKLDLHGKSHADVDQLIDRFIWDSMRNKRGYVDIITGNSEKMKKIVIEIVNDYRLKYEIGDYYNRGYIRVII
jgi:DNA-nicking Smr family endonuclease